MNIYETFIGARGRVIDSAFPAIAFRFGTWSRRYRHHPGVSAASMAAAAAVSTSVWAFRSVAYNVFPFTRATPVFTIARRTHRRSIFPLFLLCPAMRRVNGPFSLSSPLSLFPLFLSSCLFPRENLLAFVFSRPLFLLLSLCPIASVVLATSLSLVASLFRSFIFLSLSLSVFLHCRCGSRTGLGKSTFDFLCRVSCNQS